MASLSQQQITRYGLLALAGLSAEAAHAGVVTSTSVGFTPFTITGGQAQSVDFGNGVGNVFRFAADAYSGGFSFVLNPGGAGTAPDFIANGGNDPRRLAANYVVSAGRAFYGGVNAGTTNDIAGVSAGQFNGPDGSQQQGFIGVRFQSSALSPSNHYGFFDLTYDNTPNFANGALTINGFAYETTTDAPITTFATGTAVTAPEPSSLALVGLSGLSLLACGGAGLRTLRQMTKSSLVSNTPDA